MLIRPKSAIGASAEFRIVRCRTRQRWQLEIAAGNPSHCYHSVVEVLETLLGKKNHYPNEKPT